MTVVSRKIGKSETFKLKIQVPNEDESQKALVRWMRFKKLPVIHIANEGQRSFAMAAWLKAMGMRPGVYDLFLAKACKGYHGYWLEMKKKGKKLTELQAEFGEEMRREGYKAECFDNWDDARKSVEEYLDECGKI